MVNEPRLFVGMSFGDVMRQGYVPSGVPAPIVCMRTYKLSLADYMRAVEQTAPGGRYDALLVRHNVVGARPGGDITKIGELPGALDEVGYVIVIPLVRGEVHLPLGLSERIK
ncbi:MAG: hypothetical protein HYT16_04180 [DPANN group archaeon]|nr:hypothetical protein [DPANN group archaeon]